MQDLKYETLALEQPAEHLLIVRFNRPEVRNAISTQVGRDMLDLFARFLDHARDDSLEPLHIVVVQIHEERGRRKRRVV